MSKRLSGLGLGNIVITGGGTTSPATSTAAGTVKITDTITAGATSSDTAPSITAVTQYVTNQLAGLSAGGSVSVATPSTAGTVKLINSIGASDTQTDTTASINAIKTFVASNSASGTASNVGYDIIVLAGQSNMIGWGDASPTSEPLNVFTGENNAETSVIYQLRQDGAVVLATEPLAHVDNGGGNASIGSTFAKLYQNFSSNNRKILLVPGGAGSTGFFNLTHGTTTINGVVVDRTWLADGTRGFNLYEHMIRRTKIALAYHPINNPTPTYSGTTPPIANSNNRVVALLWHQGEDDNSDVWAGADGGLYKAKLTQLINNFRTSISNNTCPFVCGGLQPQCFPTPIQVELALQSIASVNYAFFAPSRNTAPYTTNLNTAPYYAANSDIGGGRFVHFSSRGYRVMGARYWNAYMLALENAPAYVQLSGTLTTSVSAYDISNNIYTVTISGYTSTTATTTNLYYSTNAGSTYTLAQVGSLSANPSLPIVTATTTNSATLIIKPNNSSASSYLFRVEAYNTFNTQPYPTLTTSTATAVPQTPAPTITGFTNSNPVNGSVILQATTVQNAITTDTITFRISGSSVGTCTVTQLLAGFSLIGSYSSFTSTTITATVQNTLNTLTSAQVSTSFTAVSTGTVTSVTTSSISSSSFVVNYTLSESSNNQVVTVRDGGPTGLIVFTQSQTSSLTTNSMTVNSGLSPSTQYSVSLSARSAQNAVVGSQTITQFTTPSLSISGTPSINSSGVLSIAWNVSPSNPVSVNWSPDTTALEPITVAAGTTSTAAFIASSTNFVAGTSYTIQLSSTTPNSGASSTPATISVFSSPISYTMIQAVTSGAMGSYDFNSSSSYSGSGVTITDLSTAGNNLTLNTAGTFNNSPKSMSFISSIIAQSVSLSTQVSTAGITLEVLFKMNSSTGIFKTIFAYGNSNDVANQISFNCFSPITTIGIWTGSQNYPLSGYTYPIDTWVHAVFTVAGGTNPPYQFYINSVATTPTQTPPNGGTVTNLGPSGGTFGSTNSNRIMIGNRVPSNGGFVGEVAVARMYNRALTSAEVTQNYNACKQISNNAYSLP